MRLLIWICALVPLIWWGLLDWSPEKLIVQKDGVLILFPYLKELMRAHGHWHQLLYWPQLMGGVKVHDMLGSTPQFQLSAFTGMSFVSSINLSVFLLQILFTFFCTRICIDLSGRLTASDGIIELPVILTVSLMFAFLPVLGWRYSYGHENIVSGLLVFVCAFHLITAEICSRRSAISLLLVFVALTQAFQFNGYQLIHYSVVFGGPVLLSLLLYNHKAGFRYNISLLVIPFLVFLSALLVSLPKFISLLANATSGDTARSLDNENVVYSYLIPNLQDWIASLPWSTGWMDKDQAAIVRHEINYPFGPLVPALLFWNWRKGGCLLLAGMVISLIMALLFSLNFTPVSTWMIDTIPYLNSFRVPGRAVLPAIITVSLLAATSLLCSYRRIEPRFGIFVSILLTVPFYLLFQHLNSLYTDLGITLTLFLAALFMTRYKNSLIPIILIAILSGSALSGFRERNLTPLSNPLEFQSLAPYTNVIHSVAPNLTRPLNRAYLDFEISEAGVNTGLALGISTLSGYWFPTSRYAKLFSSLYEIPYQPTHGVLITQPVDIAFNILNQLYNVNWWVSLAENKVHAKPLQPTLGAAWIGHKVAIKDNLTEVVRELRQLGKSLYMTGGKPYG